MKKKWKFNLFFWPLIAISAISVALVSTSCSQEQQQNEMPFNIGSNITIYYYDSRYNMSDSYNNIFIKPVSGIIINWNNKGIWIKNSDNSVMYTWTSIVKIVVQNQ